MDAVEKSSTAMSLSDCHTHVEAHRGSFLMAEGSFTSRHHPDVYGRITGCDVEVGKQTSFRSVLGAQLATPSPGDCGCHSESGHLRHTSRGSDPHIGHDAVFSLLDV